MEAMELFDVFYDDDVYDGGAEKETPTEVTAREAFVLSINRCGRVNPEDGALRKEHRASGGLASRRAGAGGHRGHARRDVGAQGRVPEVPV